MNESQGKKEHVVKESFQEPSITVEQKWRTVIWKRKLEEDVQDSYCISRSNTKDNDDEIPGRY